jgi:hypothetical protein
VRWEEDNIKTALKNKLRKCFVSGYGPFVESCKPGNQLCDSMNGENVLTV